MSTIATTSTSTPKKTPLYDAHCRLGAKMVNFAGSLMPLQYRGILAEHAVTRTSVGLFDVSHMGEIHWRGSRAAEALQHVITNDVSTLKDGRALYTVACHPHGGVVDDLIVYRIGPEHFLTVVNAANIDKDLAHFRDHVGSWCALTDQSDETALISVQGPRAQAALQGLTKTGLATLRPFDFVIDGQVAGRSSWIARTGYTGEDGFEIFCASQDAEPVWNAVLEAAQGQNGGHGGGPVGLGARDTLRLEARLCLYGNDLTDDTTPLEAGLGWVVKFDAGDFIGKAALLQQKAQGVPRKLVGFVMQDRAIARHGYPIYSLNDVKIGETTSGTVGPTVGKNIGLGYVEAAYSAPGGRLRIDCRGKKAEAEVVKGPFYKRPTA
jgi:aminomethyltransferase